MTHTQTLHYQALTDRIRQIEPFIGNTPLFPINKLNKNPKVKVLAKMEWSQLGMSVKTRPAFNIIKNAILEGQLDEHRSLLDASSGNTGVAYGAIGAALGIPVTLCLPENASLQKKIALRSYGVNIIETSRFGSTDESQDKARELFSENPDKYYYADQYNNDNNWKAHYHSTAPEIYRQTHQEVTHFVAGLGTTGTFTGTARRLKELNNAIKVISLQPDFAMHGLEGWKHLETAKVPGIYDKNLADENYEISTGDAYDMIIRAAKTEGILLSPSSAANLVGALKVASQIEEGVIVTVFPDHGSNYQEVLNELLK
jgi:cysteine synthase B